jgi:hypothetical protein
MNFTPITTFRTRLGKSICLNKEVKGRTHWFSPLSGSRDEQNCFGHAGDFKTVSRGKSA